MSKMVVFILLAILVSCTGTPEDSGKPRYVVTSPEIGEIIYLLQGSDNIVAVTEEVDYPAELKTLPKVGQFGAVSREKIIAHNPTIVFTSGLEQELLAHELSKAGIKTVLIYPRSLQDFLEGVKEIAEHLGIPERGKTVADSLLFEIESLRYDGEKRPRVYLEIYGNPIMSVSRNSFIGELVELAGGQNIFEELPRDYSRVRAEDVIVADPEIIILTYPGVTAQDIKSRKGWQDLSACRNNRIYDLDDLNPDVLLRAGSRITEGIELLQKIFAADTL